MMNIIEALEHGSQCLTESESPDIDSQYLLCHVLACTTTHLLTWPDTSLTPQQQENYMALLEQRHQGRPIAHLTGQRGFWTLDLNVNVDTLIPRPDTEIIVSMALEKIQANMIIADLGTGSGAIALALASERPDIQLLAMDYASGALKVAQDNAKQSQISNVVFWQGDWLTAIADKTLDMIVSNPPYIAQNDPHLKQGDVRFEPLTALVSGQDGLMDIRIIIEQARRCLKPKGWLFIEHGYEQAHLVASIFRQATFEHVSSVKDYGGNDRITMGQLPL